MIHFSLNNNTDIRASVPSAAKIVGGYIEFSILEHTIVHYFTKTDDLSQLENSLAEDRLVPGLKQFVKTHYIHNQQEKDHAENSIILWNYELDCQVIN